MSRLLAAARCDIELQARGGLYHATGLVLLVTAAGLAAMPPSGIARLLPAFALNSLAVTAFFFGAALAMLEAAEGSAAALAVTPLRAWERLGARAATLAMLAVAQQLALGLLLLGPAPGLLPLAAGVALAAAILALAGHALAAGTTSLGAMLPPALPWLGLLLAPMLADVLEWRSPLRWLHPLEGPMALMRAAVAPAAPWETPLGLALGLAWLLAALALALRRHERARPT